MGFINQLITGGHHSVLTHTHINDVHQAISLSFCPHPTALLTWLLPACELEPQRALQGNHPKRIELLREQRWCVLVHVPTHILYTYIYIYIYVYSSYSFFAYHTHTPIVRRDFSQATSSDFVNGGTHFLSIPHFRISRHRQISNSPQSTPDEATTHVTSNPS